MTTINENMQAANVSIAKLKLSTRTLSKKVKPQAPITTEEKEIKTVEPPPLFSLPESVEQKVKENKEIKDDSSCDIPDIKESENSDDEWEETVQSAIKNPKGLKKLLKMVKGVSDNLTKKEKELDDEWDKIEDRSMNIRVRAQRLGEIEDELKAQETAFHEKYGLAQRLMKEMEEKEKAKQAEEAKQEIKICPVEDLANHLNDLSEDDKAFARKYFTTVNDKFEAKGMFIAYEGVFLCQGKEGITEEYQKILERLFDTKIIQAFAARVSGFGMLVIIHFAEAVLYKPSKRKENYYDEVTEGKSFKAHMGSVTGIRSKTLKTEWGKIKCFMAKADPALSYLRPSEIQQQMNKNIGLTLSELVEKGGVATAYAQKTAHGIMNEDDNDDEEKNKGMPRLPLLPWQVYVDKMLETDCDDRMIVQIYSPARGTGRDTYMQDLEKAFPFSFRKLDLCGGERNWTDLIKSYKKQGFNGKTYFINLPSTVAESKMLGDPDEKTQFIYMPALAHMIEQVKHNNIFTHKGMNNAQIKFSYKPGFGPWIVICDNELLDLSAIDWWRWKIIELEPVWDEKTNDYATEPSLNGGRTCAKKVTYRTWEKEEVKAMWAKHKAIRTEYESRKSGIKTPKIVKKKSGAVVPAPPAAAGTVVDKKSKISKEEKEKFKGFIPPGNQKEAPIKKKIRIPRNNKPEVAKESKH